MGCSMALSEFNSDMANEVCGWFSTKHEALLWGGHMFGWPLDPEAVFRRSTLSGIEFFVLVDGKDVQGFIEFQVVSQNEMRLCRVAISPHYRGQGLGKKLVQLSIDKIKQGSRYQIVTLAVFRENVSASYCYRSIGFTEVDKEPKFKTFDGIQWPLSQMEIVL